METADAEARDLTEHPDVRRALQQAGAAPSPATPSLAPGQKARLVTYALAIVALAALHYALRLRFIPLAPRYLPHVSRVVLGATAIAVVHILVRQPYRGRLIKFPNAAVLT